MSIISEQKAVEYYLRKKPNVDEMIIDKVVDNGIAFIPCKVSGIDDVICKYSIKNHETLDEGFAEYIKSYADDIPTKYPIALPNAAENSPHCLIRSNVTDTFTIAPTMVVYNMPFVFFALK